MKIQIITIIIILSMITVVSAMNAGENLTITFDDTIRNCYVIGENNNLEGLNYSYSDNIDNILILQTIPNFKPDNLKIVCEVKQTKRYSSGVSRRTVYRNITVYETEYIESPNNQTQPKPEPPIIKIETVEKIVDVIPSWLLWILGFLIVILIILLGLYLSKSKNIQTSKDEDKDVFADDDY